MEFWWRRIERRRLYAPRGTKRRSRDDRLRLCQGDGARAAAQRQWQASISGLKTEGLVIVTSMHSPAARSK